ncbi:MAG: hypothetical protein J6J18_04850, partial [Oscillospiraceae bacterium]|nr:hypothetical protein [Oscillospiraceae bacterium]
ATYTIFTICIPNPPYRRSSSAPFGGTFPPGEGMVRCTVEQLAKLQFEVQSHYALLFLRNLLFYIFKGR